MKRLGYPVNRTVQSQASDARTPVVLPDAEPFCALPHFEDPLMQWYAALAARDIAVTRLVWNDQGRGPKLVQFKYRKRPCSLNGLFELGVRGNTAVGYGALAAPNGQQNVAVGRGLLGLPVRVGSTCGTGVGNPALQALQDVAQTDRLGTIRAVIEGVRVPDVRWHTRDNRGTEGTVMTGDQEWTVLQFNGGGSRAEAHIGTEPDDVLTRLCTAVEAFENGTVNVEVSARARGTSRVFRRRI